MDNSIVNLNVKEMDGASTSSTEAEMLNRFVIELSEARIRSYKETPHDVNEHYEIEQSALAGGYGYRQLFELVQNSADAILEEIEENTTPPTLARIQVSLINSILYCANTGAPLSKDGIRALLNSYSSPKRGLQIGRFGLGFKSLLRFGGIIDLFSTSVSIRFDPKECQRRVRKALGLSPETSTPGMRLAFTLNSKDHFDQDLPLANLDWATTIVRAEIVDSNIVTHISHEMAAFPREFLLFLPVDILLEIEDQGGVTRHLSREVLGEKIILTDGRDKAEWRVFERNAEIRDPNAIADATHIHNRELVPMTWAMPMSAREETAGRFWAFFPTDTPTRIAGILNAPWKLNSDRTGIIPGEWNRSLMENAAAMIVEALPKLADVDDPARTLDAFPRELDRRDELSAPLVEHLWNLLLSAPVVPDGLGNLRKPLSLHLHPTSNVELVEQWMAIASEKVRAKVVHVNCLERDRLARLRSLKRLFDRQNQGDGSELGERVRGRLTLRPELETLSFSKWLSLVASEDLIMGKEVLKLAESILASLPANERGNLIPTLQIVPTEDGDLVRPLEAILSPAGKELPSGRKRVSLQFAADADCNRILIDVLEVDVLSENVWRQELVQCLFKKEFTSFWKIFPGAPATVKDTILQVHSSLIRVMTCAGSWKPLNEVLLTGDIISDDEASRQENDSVLVDTDFHDSETLQSLGLNGWPWGGWEENRFAGHDRDTYAWDVLSEYDRFVGAWYTENLKTKRRPQWNYLRPLDSFRMPPGWALLSVLTGKAKCRLTRFLLGCATDQVSPLKTVQYGHKSQRNVYPPASGPHPLSWLLDRFGSIEIGQHEVSLATIRKASTEFEDLLRSIPDLEKVCAGIKVYLECWPEGLSQKWAKLSVLWPALLSLLHQDDLISNQTKEEIFKAAARNGFIPEEVQSPQGVVKFKNLYLTSSQDLASRATELGIASIALDLETCNIWWNKGANRLDAYLKPVWQGDLGPAVQVSEMFPEVMPVIPPKLQRKVYAQRCIGLALEFNGSRWPVSSFVKDQVILVDADQLAPLSLRGRLKEVLREMYSAGWIIHPAEKALQLIMSDGVLARRRKIADKKTLAERLLAAIGGRCQALIETFDEAVIRALGGNKEPRTVAELSIAVHGPTLLSIIRNTLAEEGLEPPSRWGTEDSEQFVQELGFPISYATSPQSRYPQELIVSGPLRLPPLHDYQREIIKEVERLIKSGHGRRRAVVSLPTGGGKTRVVVEAAVRLVLSKDEGPRSILWLAQTNELCEQAVQCFRQVWINLGAEGTDLRICRLWGGNPVPKEPSAGEPIVAVASIQTLNNRFDDKALNWLSRPAMVIIDECHHAITPSYTKLLRWLDAGLGEKESGREPLLIGLSATPFRGYNDEETNRLAVRFDRRWLPIDQSEIYEELRKRGVLVYRAVNRVNLN